jgi:hypothetical protein
MRDLKRKALEAIAYAEDTNPGDRLRALDMLERVDGGTGNPARLEMLAKVVELDDAELDKPDYREPDLP